ncbi:spindle and kinetochore-associated protein 1-like protein [Leptotrombidium deliense]|uniref:SKA complex subunit 1 n=1 Tax=Leptotrombidium deliense TaxID=299467 RepID=A0A443SVW2_9ACAR|nr:spindle and kinetochore-associated protein 1-like protein [Leptotrombidium deliense]
MNSPDLQSLLEHFTTRINAVWDLIPFVKLCNASYGQNSYAFRKYRPNRFTNFSQLEGSVEENEQEADSMPDLEAITDMIYEMKDMLCFIRQNLKNQKANLELQTERIKERNCHLKQHLCYIKENIPSFLTTKSVEDCQPQNNVKVANPKSKAVEAKPKNVENAKKVVKTTTMKEKTDAKPQPRKQKTNEYTSKTEMKPIKRSHEEIYKNWPSVSFLTTDEFESIPKYMRGRVTYEMINGAVTDFNRAIADKYKLMSTHSSKYSEEELKKYQLYKSQESADTVGELEYQLHVQMNCT